MPLYLLEDELKSATSADAEALVGKADALLSSVRDHEGQGAELLSVSQVHVQYACDIVDKLIELGVENLAQECLTLVKDFMSGRSRENVITDTYFHEQVFFL